MATNNAVNTSLSGQSGTGSFAGTTSPTFVTPVLGTPTSGTLTNCTGLQISGITGLGTGVGTALGQNVTGSGGIVLATSPTLITPNIGVATATSLAFSNYATGGIIGTSSNNNAAAGYVGEVISGEILFAARTSITTATAINIFTIALTAGDWDLYGNVGVGSSGAITSLYTGFSTVSATLPDNTYTNLNPSTSSIYTSEIPPIRVSIASPTTYYVVITSGFAGTGNKFGYYVARRAR